MTKKAIITIHLVQEAENENNEVIKNQILKAISVNSIPLYSEIETVEIEDLGTTDIAKKLEDHGFSKTAADNVVMFYHQAYFYHNL